MTPIDCPNILKKGVTMESIFWFTHNEKNYILRVMLYGLIISWSWLFSS